MSLFRTPYPEPFIVAAKAAPDGAVTMRFDVLYRSAKEKYAVFHSFTDANGKIMDFDGDIPTMVVTMKQFQKYGEYAKAKWIEPVKDGLSR